MEQSGWAVEPYRSKREAGGTVSVSAPDPALISVRSLGSKSNGCNKTVPVIHLFIRMAHWLILGP